MTTTAAEQHVEVHVVAHTHWDREWYRPAVLFQQRLVDLVDELLDLDDPPPFLLDGQAVILEDYLAMRPERAADLSARLRAGRLEAGPWYVLADALIPRAESLVRNLLAGRRVLRLLRASPPAVLYCPDSFGHPAALPTLAAGFGMPVIVAWRGYGGRRWPGGDTARWMAPDGSAALLYHLPPDGYEFGARLPVSEAEARQRWDRIRSVLAERATTGVALLPNGADHHALQPAQRAAVATLARAAGRDHVLASTMAAFAEALRARADVRELPTVSGELRDSYGYAWTLQGTFGTRSGQKRRHARLEHLLVRDAEPWAALAWLQDGTPSRHFLHASWRSLLLCQPHDTLCGCSVDAVARAMDARLEEGEASARDVRDRALARLVGHDAEMAHGRDADWAPQVVVRNGAARARSGVAEVEVDIPVADIPVGPTSAGGPLPLGGRAKAALGYPARGRQVLGTRRTVALEESPRQYPRARLVERRRMLTWLDDVPAYGLQVIPLAHRAPRRGLAVASARAAGTLIENGVLQVRADARGLSLQSGSGVIENWLAIEAEGERGDLYTHSPIADTRSMGRVLRSRITARGPLRAELTSLWEVTVPARMVATVTGESRRTPATRVRVRTHVQLDAGARYARIRVTGENRALDIRLRIRVRTGVEAPATFADAMFGLVARVPLRVPPEDSAAELPPATAPLHRYVSQYGEQGGATIFSDGLAEYEAAADGSIAVTLIRGVGELSRSDLPERPGHAGYPAEVPAAQSLGPFEAMLGFLAHGPRGRESMALVERTADDLLHPLAGTTWRTAIAPPEQVVGLALGGDGLAFSAAKESENGEWVVLRCVNLLDTEVSGTWRLGRVREAQSARLDESPLAPLPVTDGAVRFRAAPRAVVTVLVR